MFLCEKDKTPALCASRQTKPAAQKKSEEFTPLFGTFLLFYGNNTSRELRLLGGVTATVRIGSVFIF
jgi:hypothetical protein